MATVDTQNKELPSRKFQKKILVIGEGGVGKTTLLYRYVNKKFLTHTKMTIGSDFFIKNIVINDETHENHLTLMIWDFAGQERFRFVLKDYARGAQAVILAFDLVRMQSMVKLYNWIEMLQEAEIWGNPDVKFYLVGTKKDLVESQKENVVPQDIIDEFIAENKIIKYMATSAAEDIGINEFFTDIAIDVIKQDNE